MSVLDHLDDYRVVSVFLPVADGNVVTLDGVAKATTGAFLEVTFLQGQLEAHTLNQEGICRLSFDVGGQSKSIKAKISNRPAPSRLILEMVETFTYDQKRQYFRVDATLSINYWVIDDETEPAPKSIQATVNISGGGLRIPVQEKIPVGKKVGLEVVIDSPAPVVVECVGEVVNNYSQGRQVYAALRFVEIDEDARDLIVSYCLAEQRKQLRLKVQVLAGMD